MFSYFRRPHPDLAAVILRLGLAFLFIAHGSIKLFQHLSWSDQLDPTMQRVVGWAELIFGILLAIGLLSRLSALGLIAEMVGAILLVTGKRDFINPEINPHGFTFRASGFEYNVMIIIACLAVVALGSGWLSLDHLIFGRRREKGTQVLVPMEPAPHSEAIQPGGMVSTR